MFRSMPGFVFAASLTVACAAYAQQQANVAGSYRCVAGVGSCQYSGTNLTVTQTGSALSVKNERNEEGSGSVTSAITISMGPPWNMLGVLSNNNRTIEWSNGTQWQKQ